MQGRSHANRREIGRPVTAGSNMIQGGQISYSPQMGDAACMGDDLPDLSLLSRVGFPAVVRDATPEVKKVACFISKHNGGHGAVRDLAEFILKARGDWKDVIARFAE